MADKETTYVSPHRFMISVGLLCVLSVGLLFARIIGSDSMRYVFLLWNLVLAAVPVFVAWILTQRLRKYGWLRWRQIVLSVLFLGFLPNSFYLMTDFVHLRATYEASLIYDVIMLASFMLSGLIMGFVAVYILHRELLRRLSERASMTVVLTVLLACSFAIYLGRYTRWNTWDLLFQPAGLLFDVSDRVVNPAVHSDTYATTGIIFLLLGGLYYIVYEAARLVRGS